MSNGYTKNEIINKLKSVTDVSTLYKEDFINYRGNTTDTQRKIYRSHSGVAFE